MDFANPRIAPQFLSEVDRAPEVSARRMEKHTIGHDRRGAAMRAPPYRRKARFSLLIDDQLQTRDAL